MTAFSARLILAAALTFTGLAHAGEDSNVTPEVIAKLKGVYQKSETAEMVSYQRGANSLGLELFKAAYTADPSTNRVYSPSAMATHTALLANLMEERSRAKILGAAGWADLSLETINSANKLMVDFSKLYHRAYALESASAIWTDSELALSPDAQARVAENFDGVSKVADFNNPKLADKINALIKEKTKGLVEKTVEKSQLKGLNLFVANTLYFEANWRAEFLTGQVGDFKTPSGVKKVEFMNAEDELPMRILKEETYDVIGLPYAFGATAETFGDQAHGQATMMVVVPKGAHTLDEVVQLLSTDQVDTWSTNLRNAEESWFDFSMPKFKLSFQDKTYGESLEKIGMNLTGLVSENGKPVVIKPIAPKIVIEVGEKGTKAAVVQASGVSVFSSIPPYSVVVDSPFLYIIKDAATKAVVLVGVVTDPSLTE